MFRTGAQMLILIVLAGFCLLQESFWWPLNVVDDAFADHVALADRFLGSQVTRRGWAAEPKTGPVVLVGIDEPSLADHPWPWSPLDFALFLRAVQPFNPEVVGVEEPLDWDHSNLPLKERQKLPQYEKMLRESLLQTPKVLLGAHLGWPEDPEAMPPVQATTLLKNVKGSLQEVPEFTAIDEQAKEDYRLSAALGFTNLSPGARALTMVPLVLRYRGQVVPTFPLQAVLQWQQLSADDVEVVLGSHVSVGPKIRIPIDKHGQMRLNFAAPYTRIGYDEVLLAAEQLAAKQKPAAPVERFAGAIALLARTDPPAQTLPLALRKRASSGEIFATAIACIQHGMFLQRVSRVFDYSFIVVAALFGLWIPRWKKSAVVLWTALALVVYVLAALAVLHWRHLWLPLALPGGLLVFMAIYRLATPNSVWRLRRPVIL